ncbi:MAG: hypothetical protein FD122_2817, partial [Stygiobacter sp.]
YSKVFFSILSLSFILLQGCAPSPYGSSNMFGNLGLGEIIIILFVVLVLFGGLFARKGTGLRISGPELVLRRFHIDEAAEDLNVEIVGRASGLTAWLLTVMDLDAETKLLVHKTKISFKSASLSGELHQVVPMASISSTHCGYSKPIALLFLGVILFIAGILLSQAVIGLVFGGIVIVLYFISKKTSIVLETSGGMQLSLSFKRSIIENVSIDIEEALKVIRIINDNIVKQQQKQ